MGRRIRVPGMGPYCPGNPDDMWPGFESPEMWPAPGWGMGSGFCGMNPCCEMNNRLLREMYCMLANIGSTVNDIHRIVSQRG